ncbi:MAG: hypothetical protein PHQ61_08540 [Candidatus Omnitrophica bacterium]|nr:hypothetical protein [Candidatus Omnitrophota bacterium]
MTDRSAKKELLFLVDDANERLVEEAFANGVDVLAFTPSAMLELEKRNKRYLTTDMFYGTGEFREDNLRLMSDAEELLSEMDKACAGGAGYPRSFSGNILWFQVLFANLRYVWRVSDRISGGYDRVRIAASPVYDGGLGADPDISPEGLGFLRFNKGLVNRVKMFRCALGDDSVCGVSGHGSAVGNAKAPANTIASVKPMAKHVLRKLDAAVKGICGARERVFVIQDGYEVEHVRRDLRGYIFEYPVPGLLRYVGDRAGKDTGVWSLPYERINEFADKWFPGFKAYLGRLFSGYSAGVLPYVGDIVSRARSAMAERAPKALFYSISANRLYEDIFAFIANEKDIPVFYFQHGGSTVFHYDHYQRYLERNENIKKTVIYQSEHEKKMFTGDMGSEKEVIGSAKLFNIYRKESERRSRKMAGRALYCPGPFNFHNYKDLIANVSDRELFRVNLDVLEAARDAGVDMDIKIHPSDEEYNYRYFSRLAGYAGLHGTECLKGFPAEKVMGEYGMLVLDYIGSTLVLSAMVFDSPAVMYLKDRSYLEPEAAADLEKRFYIPAGTNELRDVFRLFKGGGMEHRFREDMLDKYIFPMRSGDPGKNTGVFITKAIKEA